jgi:hypothetical protein
MYSCAMETRVVDGWPNHLTSRVYMSCSRPLSRLQNNATSGRTDCRATDYVMSRSAENAEPAPPSVLGPEYYCLQQWTACLVSLTATVSFIRHAPKPAFDPALKTKNKRDSFSRPREYCIFCSYI